MRFLVDNQLPPALARLIRHEFGVQAEHVSDLGLRDASDAEIWSHASAADMIVVSKDEDFVSIFMNQPTARLVWVRIKNCRRVVLLEVFRRVWPRLMERLEGLDRFVEIR